MMCQSFNKQFGTNYISVMPTNLYGPNDNFDLASSHVLPALIRKFHEAKINNQDSVAVWGTGRPKREFLHADDLADACLFLMDNYDGSEIVNIGTGRDLTIKELAEAISEVVGFRGRIAFDDSKPDGTMRKVLDVSKIHQLGWEPKIDLPSGLASTYRSFLEIYDQIK
jgi:GDP-L-fucose synthase